MPNALSSLQKVADAAPFRRGTTAQRPLSARWTQAGLSQRDNPPPTTPGDTAARSKPRLQACNPAVSTVGRSHMLRSTTDRRRINRLNLTNETHPMEASPAANSKTLLVLAGIASGLYLLMPRIAQGMALAEPSLSGEVFPWVPHVDSATLHRIHQTEGVFIPAFVFGAVYAALFAIYLLALRVTRTGQPPCKPSIVIGAGAVFLGIQLFSPVLLSWDVYFYALYGRVLSVYGVSPYGLTLPRKKDP